MDRNIIVTETEYNQLMNYIAGDIADCRERYKSLQLTKDDWDDRYKPTSKTSGLTYDEIEKLQRSLVRRQHVLFLQWYDMNEKARAAGKSYYLPQKIRDIGSNILEVSRYTDLLINRGLCNDKG